MNTLKANLTIIIGIVIAIDKSLEDKKINFTEWIKIVSKGFGLFKVVKSWKLMVTEFETISPDDMATLVTDFETEFDLRNDEIEAYIEQIFAVIIQVTSFFTLTREVRLPKAKA